MSVQTSNSKSRVLPGKCATIYLMELRRRRLGANERQQKLEVGSWAGVELDTIPIRRRVSGSGLRN
jgi:hypothetical protein